MVRKLCITLLLVCTFSSLFGRGGLLDIVISVDIKSKSIKQILIIIENKSGVSFTYNPNIIDEKKVVSLSIRQKTIREGLSLVFDETIRFKEVGKHIVLLQNESKEELKARRKEDLEYIFAGEITDKRTGEAIRGASIYEVDNRYATVSDVKGFYSLTVPVSYEIISLYIKKKGYHEQVLVIKGDSKESALRNVALVPIESNVNPLASQDVEQIDQNINTKAISGSLVSQETFLHGENLIEIEETRIAQISLVPSVSIGSNLSTNALIYNRFSFNVLAGFSKGVEGVEIGGLVNLNKQNMTGVQVAGIANLVGGDVRGVQAGGIANLLQGNATGLQLGGITTIMKRDLVGAQVSGISSIVRGGFTGAQISGISNITWKKSRGAQVSGILNLVKDSLVGGQIAGISNFSNGGVNFIQIGGISNFAHINNGAQIAGINNFSRVNNGVQIGLINSSISGNGIGIGLFNFVKEGYHKTEISANEIFPVNLAFKTGTQRLYNIYNFGARFGPDRAYAAGLGFGSYFNLNKKLMMSLDLTTQMVFENDFEKFEFTQLNKASLTLDWKIHERIALFGGPSFNVNVNQFAGDDGDYSTKISFLPIYDSQGAASRVVMWVGGQVGVRL